MGSSTRSSLWYQSGGCSAGASIRDLRFRGRSRSRIGAWRWYVGTSRGIFPIFLMLDWFFVLQNKKRKGNWGGGLILDFLFFSPTRKLVREAAFFFFWKRVEEEGEGEKAEVRGEERLLGTEGRHLGVSSQLWYLRKRG